MNATTIGRHGGLMLVEASGLGGVMAMSGAYFVGPDRGSRGLLGLEKRVLLGLG